MRAFGQQTSEVSRFGVANVDTRDYETKAELIMGNLLSPFIVRSTIWITDNMVRRWT